jgi:hypothetical protein
MGREGVGAAEEAGGKAAAGENEAASVPPNRLPVVVEYRELP